MSPPSKVKQLSAEAAAYLAGLIDGEGTVTLTRLHANENRRLVVSIANTELALLTFAIEQIGVGKITRKRTSSSKHTPSFCYGISSQQALDLLRQITPYLRSYKRKRAQLALDQYKSVTPRNGEYDRRLNTVRRQFEIEFLSLKAGC